MDCPAPPRVSRNPPNSRQPQIAMTVTTMKSVGSVTGCSGCSTFFGLRAKFERTEFGATRRIREIRKNCAQSPSTFGDVAFSPKLGSPVFGAKCGQREFSRQAIAEVTRFPVVGNCSSLDLNEIRDNREGGRARHHEFHWSRRPHGSLGIRAAHIRRHPRNARRRCTNHR